MNNNIKLANQKSQRTGIIFILFDHNIDKLKGELLYDIKTSDDEETKTDNALDNYDYPFVELPWLRWLTSWEFWWNWFSCKWR